MRKKMKIIIDICTACGAKCKYCLHQYRNMVSGKKMSREVFYKILDILKKERYSYVYPYLSGEPLLHPQYWEFMTSASKAGIVTNTATKLCIDIDKKDMTDTFSSLSVPMHFDITIDADNQKTQDKIAKHINIDQVFENLTTLASTIGKAPVSILVITVVNAFNEDRLSKILERVYKCGVKAWCPKAMGYFMGYVMRQEDILMISDMEPRHTYKRFLVKNGELVCHKSACEYIIPVIGVDGQVTICCHDMLYHESKWNILETGSLNAIIHSKEYQEKTNLGKKVQLPICKGCN
jgi:MoaA/NifB/PqqE/SkfB family radical SAM enzyme